MDKFKVSTRLMWLVGLLAVLVYGIGELGLFGITDSNEALQSVYRDRAVPATELGEIRALNLDMRVHMNAALVTPSPSTNAEHAGAIEANLAAVAGLWKKQAERSNRGDEDALARAFAAENAKLGTEGMAPVATALRANDLERARSLLVEKVRSQFNVTEQALKALIQFQLDAAQSEYANAVARYKTIQKIAITAVVGGLLFALLSGVALIRSLSRQLGGEPAEAAAVARAVAAGELDKPIALRPGDTTSVMAQLKAMQEGLSAVVTGVRTHSDSVAAASARIARGNGDLSERTGQQAAALEKTAVSMQQLSTTVSRNAESAGQANELAKAASALAAKGGEVVTQVVSTMKGINDSSKQIANIIGLIDGIAFQTNILALNAAVEAARAGEQGRGFAVVASEVRSLAQRSGKLAREIKGLISASVERVDQGTSLVDRAGTTMNEVVTSIRRVSDIVTEISTASAEQRVGVGEVEQSLVQMDRGTQQNAAQVQECASAAHGLREQAQALVGAVAVFTVARGMPAAG